MCRRWAHYGRGNGKIRSAGRNPARKEARHLPPTTKKQRWRTQALVRRAKSRPAQRARGAKADFATRREPESQERAAAEVKRARRNTPCGNDNRHVRRARRRPPGLARGRWASPPATGCKQWPASFSRFEYHPAGEKKLNGFWLLHVNFWRLFWPEHPCPPRGFSRHIWPGPCRNPFCNPSSTISLPGPCR